MVNQKSKIICTLTDEAPYLATAAFLPIIQTFTQPADIEIETSDISVAGRVLGEFPDYLTPEQKVADNLADLGSEPSSQKQTSSNCPTSALLCTSWPASSKNSNPKDLMFLIALKTPKQMLIKPLALATPNV